MRLMLQNEPEATRRRLTNELLRIEQYLSLIHILFQIRLRGAVSLLLRFLDSLPVCQKTSFLTHCKKDRHGVSALFGCLLSSVYESINTLFQSSEPVFQDGAGTGDVHAQEGVAVAAVCPACGEIQARLLADEGGKRRGVGLQAVAAQPQKIGRIAADHMNLRNFLFDKRGRHPAVFRDICPQLRKPRRALRESGDRRRRCV